MASVAITRNDVGSAGLRAAARSLDAKQARRLLALAMVLDGHPRLLAAQAGGSSNQGVRRGPADAARLGSPLQRARG